MSNLKTTSVLAVLVGALWLNGCSSLPSQGPSAAKVESDAKAPNGAANFLITDLNERNVAILERRSPPSFRSKFGDYRPAPSQVIGVGDAITVTVWEAAAGGLFSAPALGGVTTGSHSAIIPEQVVARDGSITVPYAGRVRVAGLTPPQVEEAIVKNLSGKAIEPQALVTVSRNISNTVTVTGEVTAGARVPLTSRGDKILDVVATAGGIRVPAHETFISLTRDNQTATVPFQALLARPQENIFVRPNDVLTLVREPQTFTAALNPALVRSLDQMLANVTSGAEQVIDARGPAKFAGSQDDVFPAKKKGHIPGAINLPWGDLIVEDSGELVQPEAIKARVAAAGIDLARPIVVTCASGTIACVVMLALYLIGKTDLALYDGSWAEWGLKDETPSAAAA